MNRKIDARTLAQEYIEAKKKLDEMNAELVRRRDEAHYASINLTALRDYLKSLALADGAHERCFLIDGNAVLITLDGVTVVPVES